ncbi:hypothetical protein [Desulfosarcina ovata]|uniref:hypothetical protein n=1 Tax=Desulfosarcina ovata TaxID=83564 RepID=UPI0012D32200|nr:hypothetical protein [Desulfosarcina ovata]
MPASPVPALQKKAPIVENTLESQADCMQHNGNHGKKKLHGGLHYHRRWWMMVVEHLPPASAYTRSKNVLPQDLWESTGPDSPKTALES